MEPRSDKNASEDDLSERDLIARLNRAEESLRARELSFRLIVDSIPSPVAVTTPTGEVEGVNQPTIEYFGKTFEELKSWKASDIVHPDDLEQTIALQLQAHETGQAYNVESRHRRADGVYRWFNVRGFPLRDTEGHILRWFHLLIDIDDRKRAEAQLAGEKRLLEMVASGSALPDILTELSKFVEDTARDCNCGIYLIDWREAKFHLGAAPSLPATFNDPVEGLTVTSDAGPCGAAALTKSQVIVTDIESDPRFQSATIRPLLLAHGLRSHWSTPIHSRDGQVLGTFAIFQETPSSPSQLQQDLIAQVTHIASIAIERALADAALRSSENNLSLTINTIPTLIQVSRPDGTILSVNQAVLDYYGVTVQDMQKEDFRARFYHPDDVARLLEERKQALRHPVPFEYEQRALGKDGKYRWFQVRYNPLLDDQGRIERWYATASDIEDRKRADEALYLAERNLNQIINTIPAHIYVLNTEGSVQYVNQAVMDYTGLGLEDVKQDDYRDRVIHPEDFQKVREGRAASLRRGAPFSTEQRVLGNDGQYRWFLVRYKPLLDDQQRIVQWYVAAFDIEDRKRAEQALHAAERNLDQIINTIPALAWSARPDGSADFFNQHYLDFVGLTAEQASGWGWTAAVHPDDLNNLSAAWQRITSSEGPGEAEARMRGVGEEYRWFLFRASPVRDEKGNIVKWYGINTDIEDLKKAETALQSSERNLRQITDVIPTVIHVLRPDGSVLYVNQPVLDYTGLTMADVLKEDYRARVFHPEDLERVREERRNSLARPKLFENEQRALGKDGKYRWFLARYNPLLNEQGKIDRWYVASFDIEDRKQAEAQRDRTIEELQAQQLLLSESEQRFRTIFDEAGVGISLVDLQHSDVPIQTNRALQTMVGLTQETLGFAETFNQLTAAADREADAATYQELREGKRNSLRLEKHFILRDGSSVFANVIFTLLRDEAGLPRFIVAIHEDITERKRAVERLQANRDLLALAQKSARAMAFDWYVQKELNHWSPEQEALHGMLPGSFDGTFKRWKKTIYPPDWPILVNAIKHAEQTGEVTAEWRIVWPDGSLHWLATNGQMFFDAQGKPFRIVGFTADVTRRKLAEEELRRSEAFLAEAQQLSAIGSFSWRVKTGEITWSEQLYRIYEFEIGAPVTLKLIRTRVHPEDITLLEKMIENARDGANEFEWQYRLLMPDNSIKYLHAVAHATQDGDGQLEYIAAVQDVTERRLSEETLDKLQSELAHMARVTSLGALTASIAHEVNQPLSGIITNASTCVRMLDADPPNIDGARVTAQRTIRDGHRAADVITQLRALFSKKDITIEPVDLNEATQEVIALSLNELQRNRVLLQPKLADDLPPVAGDRVQLQQVILNLVKNASDAMSTVDDRPRELLIRTEPENDDQVRLSVQDAGVGFDPEVVSKLFDAFYTTKTDGMGIGLSVCRSIIATHQGHLWATLNEGPGATFSFSIPRAAPR